MAYHHVGKASPLRRLMTARGVGFMQVAVHSEVAMRTVQKLDRLDPKVIGDVKIKSVMKVAKFFGCAPADLLPFLSVRLKQKVGPVVHDTVLRRGHS